MIGPRTHEHSIAYRNTGDIPQFFLLEELIIGSLQYYNSAFSGENCKKTEKVAEPNRN